MNIHSLIGFLSVNAIVTVQRLTDFFYYQVAGNYVREVFTRQVKIALRGDFCRLKVWCFYEVCICVSRMELLFRDLVLYRQYNRRLNPISTNPQEWSNTLKTIRRLLPTNCLSLFDHFERLALKGLILCCCFFAKFCVVYQLAITFSILTIETLEPDVKYVQS